MFYGINAQLKKQSIGFPNIKIRYGEQRAAKTERVFAGFHTKSDCRSTNCLWVSYACYGLVWVGFLLFDALHFPYCHSRSIGESSGMVRHVTIGCLRGSSSFTKKVFLPKG